MSVSSITSSITNPIDSHRTSLTPISLPHQKCRGRDRRTAGARRSSRSTSSSAGGSCGHIIIMLPDNWRPGCVRAVWQPQQLRLTQHSPLTPQTTDAPNFAHPNMTAWFTTRQAALVRAGAAQGAGRQACSWTQTLQQTRACVSPLRPIPRSYGMTFTADMAVISPARHLLPLITKNSQRVKRSMSWSRTCPPPLFCQHPSACPKGPKHTSTSDAIDRQEAADIATKLTQNTRTRTRFTPPYHQQLRTVYEDATMHPGMPMHPSLHPDSGCLIARCTPCTCLCFWSCLFWQQVATTQPLQQPQHE